MPFADFNSMIDFDEARRRSALRDRMIGLDPGRPMGGHCGRHIIVWHATAGLGLGTSFALQFHPVSITEEAVEDVSRHLLGVELIAGQAHNPFTASGREHFALAARHRHDHARAALFDPPARLPAYADSSRPPSVETQRAHGLGTAISPFLHRRISL